MVDQEKQEVEEKPEDSQQAAEASEESENLEVSEEKAEVNESRPEDSPENTAESSEGNDTNGEMPESTEEAKNNEVNSGGAAEISGSKVEKQEEEEDPSKVYEEKEEPKKAPPKLDLLKKGGKITLGGGLGNLGEIKIKGAEKRADEDLDEPVEEEASIPVPKKEVNANIFALRTTANREDQVMDFVSSNAEKKNMPVYCIIRPHGMRGYIFMEAADRSTAEEAVRGIPYSRGILPNQVEYSEIEHMLEQVKKEINMQKNDIVEVISGAFKREKAKVTRIDKTKEEVVVELLEAAVPIPITLKVDAVKVIRRPGEDENQ